jgi:hypothetical protein
MPADPTNDDLRLEPSAEAVVIVVVGNKTGVLKDG